MFSNFGGIFSYRYLSSFYIRAVVYQAKIGKHPEQFIVKGTVCFVQLIVEGVELVEKLLLVFIGSFMDRWKNKRERKGEFLN